MDHEALPRNTQFNNATLLEIIKAQSDIAKLGHDLGGVMAYVAGRAAQLTRATGAVVALAVRSSGGLGVLNLDMDGLKPINDRYGHRAGDAAIRETAERSLRNSRRVDTATRVGGDEFAVLLPGVRRREDAQAHSLRLMEKVGEPFEFEGHRIDLGVSVGVAVLPEDGTEMTSLIEYADRSMYESKRERKHSR